MQNCTKLPKHSKAVCSTAWKVSKYGVFSGPYFPIFGLDTEIFGVNLRIQSEYRKIRTRGNSIYGHFSRSVGFFVKIWNTWNSKQWITFNEKDSWMDWATRYFSQIQKKLHHRYRTWFQIRLCIMTQVSWIFEVFGRKYEIN